MVFSSLIFLLFFLPVFMLAYYLTPMRGRSVTILIGSYVFYAWWRVDFLFLLIAVTLWNYLIAHHIVRILDEKPLLARWWMQFGVALNLMTLGIFKYFNFGIDSLNAILETSGMNTIEALRFILPIGISFYIFQAISFLIDVYRKDAPPPRHFADFAAYKALFPQLIAGPVLRYKDLAEQFNQRTHSFDLFSRGAYRFMSGFAKKVLIADTVAALVEKTFAIEDPTMADAWLGAVSYTIQLYFDFSGYSDMAVGLAMMMGFRFIENFNNPYISRTITEFWRRWHISLSTWLRDYLYIPMGGSRRGKLRTYINLFLTMLLGGLWHGANWTFVLWGAWHGGIMTLERAAGLKNPEAPSRNRFYMLVSMALTTLLVILGWVMFRADTVGQAFSFYKAMFSFDGAGLSESISWQITGASMTALTAGVLLVYVVPYLQAKTGTIFRESRNPILQLGSIIFFLLAVVKLSAESYSPFLYFQF